MATDEQVISVKHVSSGLIVGLGFVVTGMLFARGFNPPAPSGALILQLGGVISVTLFVLLAANARNRVIAFHLKRELDALSAPSTANHGEAPVPPPAAPPVSRMAPAWLALVFGIATTVVFSQDPQALLWLTDSPLTLTTVLSCTLLWGLSLSSIAHGGRVLHLHAAHQALALNLQIDALRADAEATCKNHEEATARLEGKLESQTKSCQRLRGDLETTELAHRSTKEDLASTRGALASTSADLASLSEAHVLLDGESRRQGRLLEKLRGQVQTMETDENALRAELERTDDQLAKANIRLEKARRLEGVMQTKITRLTERTQTLEDELTGARSRPTGAGHDPTTVVAGVDFDEASRAEPVEVPRLDSAPPVAATPEPSPAEEPHEGTAPQTPEPTVARARPSTILPIPDPRDPVPAPANLPRLLTELLECNLGDIVEMGRSEVRLHCPQAIEGRMTVVLPAGKTKLRVEADVLLCERITRRKHDVVLRFVGLRSEIAQQILQIAMMHRRRSVLPINSISQD